MDPLVRLYRGFIGKSLVKEWRMRDAGSREVRFAEELAGGVLV
jgi:hypothetical protein